MLAFSSTNFRRSKARRLVLTMALAVDILGAHVLVVHCYHVSVVAAHVSLFVLILIWQSLHFRSLWITTLKIGIVMLISDVTISTCLVSMYARQFFRMLFVRPLISTTCVHRKRLIEIAHVLGGPEILQNVLHILVICAGLRSSSGESCLIVHASAMGTFYSHVSKIAWIDKI